MLHYARKRNAGQEKNAFHLHPTSQTQSATVAREHSSTLVDSGLPDCRFRAGNYHKKMNHRPIAKWSLFNWVNMHETYVLFTSTVICGSYCFSWLAFARFFLFGAHCKKHSLCSVLISQMCIIHTTSMRRRSEQRDVPDPEIIASTRISSHE